MIYILSPISEESCAKLPMRKAVSLLQVFSSIKLDSWTCEQGLVSTSPRMEELEKKWVRRVRPKDRGVWSFPMNSPRSEGHLSLSPSHLHVLRTHEAAFPSVTRCWRTSHLDQSLKNETRYWLKVFQCPCALPKSRKERNPQQLDIMDSPSPSCPYHFTHSLIILLRLKSTFLSLNIPRCSLWRIFQSHKSFH